MKCLIQNDLRVLLKTIKIFAIIVFIDYFFTGISIKKNMEILNMVMGRMGPTSEMIAIAYFVLHIIFFIYIAQQIYINDIIYNRDNLFLRISPTKFIIEKISCIVLTVLIFRAIEYCFIYDMIIMCELSYKTVIIMILKDVIFISAISIISIFARQITYEFKNLHLAIMFIVLFVIPKDIDKLYLQNIVILIIFIIGTVLMMKDKSQNIIETEDTSK